MIVESRLSVDELIFIWISQNCNTATFIILWSLEYMKSFRVSDLQADIIYIPVCVYVQLEPSGFHAYSQHFSDPGEFSFLFEEVQELISSDEIRKGSCTIQRKINQRSFSPYCASYQATTYKTNTINFVRVIVFRQLNDLCTSNDQPIIASEFTPI